jgi:transcriptional regulator with XRE-family HTH domain
MATYRIPTLSLDESPISRRAIIYYVRRFQREIWELVVREFDRLGDEEGLTQKAVAERLRIEASQLNRWLSEPGNWTLETLAKLLIGMGIDPRRIVAELEVPQPTPEYHPGTFDLSVWKQATQGASEFQSLSAHGTMRSKQKTSPVAPSYAAILAAAQHQERSPYAIHH